MKQVKSIIFVTVSMGGGGTERVISILANHYVNKNIPVTILMIADNRIAYELDNRIQVINISEATGGSLVGRIKRVTGLRDYFKKNKDADIIAMGTVAAMFTLLAKAGLRRNVVISERNDPNRLNHKPISKTAKLLRNFLYHGAKTIALQTEDVKECFPDYLVKKSVVIPNPLSTELPKTDNSIAREKTIITAGRLTEQKNHKLLMDAFEEFSKQYKGYSLHIFGKGELEEQLEAVIYDKKMQDCIFLEGFSEDLYGELQKGGIYVSSSNWEGISNSLVEALAMGIPTIATDCPVGGSRMFIRNMENGILIPTNDKEALVNALIQLASDQALYQKVSQEGYKIRKELAVDRIADMWLQALE